MLRALVLAAALAATLGTVEGDARAQATDAPAAAAPAGTAPPASTGVARPNAADPVLEKRLQAVTKELRCMVCQNESIADSHAPLAVDMRNEIRDQLKSGMSEQQVIAFMVERYGNFVRFRPPLDWTTIGLWFGPALLMILGFGALLSQMRQRRNLSTMRAVPELSAAERAALASLADGDSPRSDRTQNDKTGNR